MPEAEDKVKPTLAENLAKLPLPATEKWRDGVWDVEAFAHGTMSTILFAPRGTDYQTAHQQDELYFVRAHHSLCRAISA